MNILPELPQKRKHREADVTPEVLLWFEKNYPRTVALEIKVDKNKLLPHQKIALQQVEFGVFKYKLPDMGRKNPFDGFVMKNADAFVVVCEKRKCIAYTPGMEKRFEINL